MKHSLIRSFLKIIVILLALALLYFLITHARVYFNRVEIRNFQRLISSYGYFSPIVVLLLILLSTSIPPLPLPIPLIEVAAGLVFGFWPAAILIWISQFLSSIMAFKMAKFFRNRFLKSVWEMPFWQGYKNYLDKSGLKAVFIIRATMAAPFNSISFLAGVTKMRIEKFIFATALGVIPEVLLYTFIGSQLKNIHFRIAYIFIAVLLISSSGIITSYISIRGSKKSQINQ